MMAIAHKDRAALTDWRRNMPGRRNGMVRLIKRMTRRNVRRSGKVEVREARYV